MFRDAIDNDEIGPRHRFGCIGRRFSTVRFHDRDYDQFHPRAKALSAIKERWNQVESRCIRQDDAQFVGPQRASAIGARLSAST